MISHSSDDRELIDELEKVIHFCGFSKEEVLYTSSKYYESSFQAYTDIYEYLKDFFVNTTRRNDLGIIYVLNASFVCKWDPVLEAGAGWVLGSKWYPMYSDTHKNVKKPFPVSEYTPYLAFNMSDKQVHYLASALFQVATNAGKSEQTEQSIYNFIKATRLYKDD